ncbi:MAG: phenylalanine--tRNA ligase subunit beta [Coriobacteriia bacterium]
MLVPLSWLKELLDIDLTVEELVDRLDMTGTAVEATRSLGDALDGVVVGRIVSKERHPDAEKLWVTSVDVGGDGLLPIVCGAQNFEAGDKVPVALVGATLPDGTTIKKAKLRGVTSEGMNCSAAELGVSGDASGLLVLAPDAPVGVPFAQWYGLADTVLELEVTPNRPDCLSMAGVAREVAAIAGGHALTPSSKPVESGRPASEEVAVVIADPDLCPRYTARLIRGVRIGPSPTWLAERVAACGARPIDNVVDVTNLVLFELGQPLHAFDAHTLAPGPDGRTRVEVRLAQAGERLTTLDGQDRELAADTLVITDGSGPVALAGVMGGAATEVTDATTDVLLESACFQPGSISRTSRRLGLVSEASMRFERGVDPNGCVAALDRAAALIAEVAGGTVATGVVDEYPAPAAPRSVRLRVARTNAVLGTDLDADDVAAPLRRLGLGVEIEGQDLAVTVPTSRPDLEREIDLIEEVVRVTGMHAVPSTLPAGRGRIGGLTPAQRWRERIGAVLRGAGLCETITYSFADPRDAQRLRMPLGPGEVPVRLLNPMSEEQSIMRSTIAGGLLRAVSNNQRRGVADVHIYEIGTVFFTSEGRKAPKERETLAGALAGRWHRPAWNDPPVGPNSPAQLDAFDGTGVLETLFEEIGAAWRLRPSEAAWLQAGRSGDVIAGGEVIGWIGEVHPLVLDVFECDGPVTLFELSMAGLLRLVVPVRTYVEVPRFPAVELDIAIVVSEDVSHERVAQAIASAGGKLLDEARLFDVYRDPEDSPDATRRLPRGTKSLAFSLAYRAPDRTLTAEEVDPVHQKLVRKVCGAVDGSLRS